MKGDKNMTYEEYINNPLQTRLGGQTRELYRMMYNSKLDKILVRINNEIEYYTYKNSKDGSYFLYIKVPSEVVKDFTYDVIIHFVRPGHNVDFDKDLTHYNVEFFSNDPAFVYNLEYTFKSKKMFVDDLKSKALPEALRNAPKTTNPNNQIVYCKSLYFAYLIAKQRGLFAKGRYLDEYDKKRLVAAVQDSATKIEQRQELGQKANKEEKKIKEQRQIKTALSRSKVGRGVDFTVSNPDFSLKAIKAPKSNKKINFNKTKKV